MISNNPYVLQSFTASFKDSQYDLIDPDFITFKASKYSVLLVDDDEDQLQIFELMLRKEGFKVFTVASALDAINLMSHIYFDVVISDLRMPHISGLDFMQKIRETKIIPSSNPVPIIALTASDENLEDLSLSMGADMFCEKQFAKTRLIPQIKFLLGF